VRIGKRQPGDGKKAAIGVPVDVEAEYLAAILRAEHFADADRRNWSAMSKSWSITGPVQLPGLTIVQYSG